MIDKKARVAAVSVIASAVLAVAKMTVGIAIGSLALISDALHSTVDLGATAITWFVVRISDRPADEEHHYGHGKIESLSALGLTAMLYVLAGGIIVEAVARLRAGSAPSETSWIAFFVMAIEIGVNYWRASALRAAAKETQSQALAADALHFATDMYGSFAVIAGLVLLWLGFGWGDAAAAIAVAVVIFILAFKLGRQTIESLMDRAPEGAARIAAEALGRIPGILAVERLRVRNVGPQNFVDVVVHVPRTLPLDRIDGIKQTAQIAVSNAIGAADLTFTAVPVAQNSESVRDRINVIARNRALAIHHVTVHDLGSHLTIGIDLEVDGKMSLSRAHDITRGLENAIRQEFGEATEVDTHIEPLQPDLIQGADAPRETTDNITAALTTLATERAAIRDMHDVRVRASDDGYVVNFHCRADPRLSVTEVHDRIDEIERGLRRLYPQVRRVISHAEPLRR